MSYFEDASLVLIPSAQKISKVYSIKPTDGSGDLTFTRSNDTATRVGPDGLIEKVRTNLLTYSQAFDNAAWTKGDLTVSANTTETLDPLGLYGADKLILNAISGPIRIYYTISVSASEHALSFYVKYNNRQFVQLLFGGSLNGTAYANFDLINGTVTSGTGGQIQSLANGWYRISLTATLAAATDALYLWSIDSGTAARGAASTGNGVDGYYVFGAQFETGVMTDYIATTSAAVSVGPVANLPRLDYSGGATCPSLLLEPQRTNLALYSEQFDNGAYVKVNISVTANATTSPDGYTNADKIESTAAPAAAIELRQSFTLTAQSYVASVYLKQGSGSTDLSNFDIYNGGGSYQARTSLNFATGVLTQSIGTGASVVNVGNGWFRVSVPFTGYAGTNYIYIGNSGTYEASGKYVYAYGFQLEAGAYGTSYIGPTLGSAVTRGADAAFKTSATALIGQTEGTIFVEANVPSGFDGNNLLITASDGSTSNMIFINRDSGRAEYYIAAGGVEQAAFAMPTVLSTGVHKLAIAYKANDFAFYVDGVLVHSDTSGSVPACSRVNVGSYVANALPYNDGISQAIIFPTRLSNSQLAELTA